MFTPYITKKILPFICVDDIIQAKNKHQLIFKAIWQQEHSAVISGHNTDGVNPKSSQTHLPP
jgi:hypothetical protein